MSTKRECPLHPTPLPTQASPLHIHPPTGIMPWMTLAKSRVLKR